MDPPIRDNQEVRRVVNLPVCRAPGIPVVEVFETTHHKYCLATCLDLMVLGRVRKIGTCLVEN